MIETSLNVTDYPTPPEVADKAISGTITVTFNLDAEVPSSWNEDAIISDIKKNLNDYIFLNEYSDIEIDI